jgi:hypothetical protein
MKRDCLKVTAVPEILTWTFGELTEMSFRRIQRA